MTAKYNPSQSWEKQNIFNLSNGWIATVEYSVHYGEFISRLDSEDGKNYWHCSDGLKTLPQFALPWVEVVHKLTDAKMVKPKFDRVY